MSTCRNLFIYDFSFLQSLNTALRLKLTPPVHVMLMAQVVVEVFCDHTKMTKLVFKVRKTFKILNLNHKPTSLTAHDFYNTGTVVITVIAAITIHCL